MVTDFDCIGFLEGAEETQFLKVCKNHSWKRGMFLCGIPHTRIGKWTTMSFSTFIRRQSDSVLRTHHASYLRQLKHTKKSYEFKAGPHHMYIQAKRDPDQQWLLTSYRLTKQDVSLIVNDWEAEWRKPMLEAMQKETQHQEKDQ
jgi:hypothetical protein